MRIFSSAGYVEVQTPTFEYLDVFSSGIGSIKHEHTVKFFDTDGKILVLRPDMTMPLARLAATKLVNFPARLCYIGNAYGCENAYYTNQREFTQAGVECLGVAGDEADAEMIALSIQALLSAGLKDFMIDIGQVEFFKGLMEEAGLNSLQSEELRELIDQKNDVAVEYFLKSNDVSHDIKGRIMQLTALFGSQEVLTQALALSKNPRCIAAVENVRRVYSILCDFGYKQYISIDLGMLQGLDYYTGVIFKGISSNIGFSLLSGGRYDNLLQQFDKPMCAVGFALGLKRVLIALEKQQMLIKCPTADMVLSSNKQHRGKAFELLCELRNQGKIVISAFEMDKIELTAYAKKIGAEPVFVEEN